MLVAILILTIRAGCEPVAVALSAVRFAQLERRVFHYRNVDIFWQPICDGANRISMVGRNHSNRWSYIDYRLAYVGGGRLQGCW